MIITLDARTATPHFPGIGRYVKNLCKQLPEVLAKEETLQVIYSPEGGEWLLELPSNKNIRRLSQVASPFGLAQQWKIPKTLKQMRCDLYHSPYYLMPYRTPAPTVLTIYDLIPLRFPQYSSGRARLLFRFTTTLALKTVRKVIAISQSTKNDYINYFSVPKENISVIPLGVDEHFHPQPIEEVRRMQSKYHLPQKYALYLGSNKPHKNLKNLIDAWAYLVKDRSTSEYKLVVAGAWDNKQTNIIDQAKNSGITDAILFLGNIAESDLAALYSSAHIFVFPSLYEGFGLPVLEAMACGVPVACSNIPCLYETGGEAVFYFNPLDIKEISESLFAVWHDVSIRDHLISRGLEQASRFSWKKTAFSTILVYRETYQKEGIS